MDTKTNDTHQEDEPKVDYTEMDFGYQYSDNLPQILRHLNISLAFTSYQAGRLMLVRTNGDTLDIEFASFPRPMGLVCDQDSLTLGTFTQVLKFQREDGLLEQMKRALQSIDDDVTAPRVKPVSPNVQSGQHLPTNSETEKINQERQAYWDKLHEPVDEHVDACFISRSSHYTGMINIHDIAWGNEGLWAVNSSFSCLCTLDSDYSFVPKWVPPFITELVPEDRCHLNGMALKDGQPAYVTTFSKLNEPGKWRKNKDFDGTLIDVNKNQVVLDGLSMPHSPRWHRGKVYFCDSGHGAICCYSPETGKKEVIAEVAGFTRGMDFHGPLMFVGLSKVRQGDVTRPAPLGEKYDETYSGVWVFDLETQTQVAQISFSGNVDQIYDIAVIPECTYPELIDPKHPRMRNHFCFPRFER